MLWLVYGDDVPLAWRRSTDGAARGVDSWFVSDERCFAVHVLILSCGGASSLLAVP